MNNRALTLSLIMAAFAIFFVQSYVTSIEDNAKKKFGTEVLVIEAKRDIKEAETINETMLELKLVPKRFLEPAAISYEKKAEDDKESSQGLKNLAGMVAVVPIKKGEQITLNKMVEPGIRTGLAPQIAPGKRAIAVPVGETSSVAKLVKPGDRVDVIAVLDMGGGKEGKIAKTIMQDAVVLAVGRSVTGNIARTVEQDPNGGKDKVKSLAEDFSFASVTLEVEPIQAEQLALIMNSGDNVIDLSLRNNDDTDRQNIISTSYMDMLGADISKVRKPAGATR
jgi:pilus assembly protein CpaB